MWGALAEWARPALLVQDRAAMAVVDLLSNLTSGISVCVTQAREVREVLRRRQQKQDAAVVQGLRRPTDGPAPDRAASPAAPGAPWGLAWLAATVLAYERTISFSFARKPLSSRQAEVK